MMTHTISIDSMCGVTMTQTKKVSVGYKDLFEIPSSSLKKIPYGNQLQGTVVLEFSEKFKSISEGQLILFFRTS
jgi:hypothetical protein